MHQTSIARGRLQWARARAGTKAKENGHGQGVEGRKRGGRDYIQRGRPGAGEREERDGPRNDPAELMYMGDQAIELARSDVP